MSDKTPSRKSVARAKLFLEFVSEREGKTVKFEELQAHLIKNNLSEKVSPSTIRDALYLANESTPRGYEISVHTQMQEATYTKRDGDHDAFPDIKKKLGDLLWWFLLDLSHLNDPGHRIDTIPESLQKKIGALRQKGVLSVVSDAGTTTRAAMDRLLKRVRVPLQPKLASNNAARFIRPIVTTNDLKIANMVHDHPDAEELDLRFVGGGMRAKRSSFCGPLSENFLRSNGLLGDISIIGTTGFRSAYDGTPSFGCDSPMESRIKLMLMEMSWFRVILFHSEKLKYPEVSSIFAALSPQTITLVVTDDGNLTRATSEVQEFRQNCREAGVPVLILET